MIVMMLVLVGCQQTPESEPYTDGGGLEDTAVPPPTDTGRDGLYNLADDVVDWTPVCDRPEPTPFGVETTADLSTGEAGYTWPSGSSTISWYPGHWTNKAIIVEDEGVVALDEADNILAEWRTTDRLGRLVMVGDKLIASMPEQRKLTVLSTAGAALDPIATIDTCAEPFGLVAREDGGRFYAACAGDDLVVEYDGHTFEELRRWNVEGQPRWLALWPQGSFLYVAGSHRRTMAQIDLAQGAVGWAEPREVRITTLNGNMTHRFTGDPSVTADGRRLGAPMIVVDNDGILIDGTPTSAPTYYGPTGLPLQRFNPTVGVFEISQESGGLFLGKAHLITTARKAFPTSVTWAPNGYWLAAPMRGGDSMLFARPTPGADWENSGTSGIYRFAREIVVKGDAGPEHASYVRADQILVSNRIARTVQRFDPIHAAASSSLNQDLDAGLALLTREDLDPVEELGRALFHSAVDERISDPANPVSCSTCHFEGGNDGLTWRVGNLKLQMPSLATAAHTAPYTWATDVATIADEAMLTSTVRLNSTGGGDFDAVEAYVSTFEVPDIPTRGVETQAVTRGALIFHDPDVGCANCHSGDFYTDGNKYQLVGSLPMATPTLTGIAATAPYFHDGSAEDLYEVVERSMDGSMGYTGDLSCDDMADLVAFLKSL